MFATITLIRLDELLLDRAGDLGAGDLRSLNAIHLAAVLSIGPELGVLLTYDACLRDAALAQGCPVESPGA